MPARLTPMVDHTKARTAQQNHKGQPAADQTGMDQNSHWADFLHVQTYWLYGWVVLQNSGCQYKI